MKISNYSIQMGSVSSHSLKTTTLESLRAWADPSQSAKQESFPGVNIDLTEEGKALAEDIRKLSAPDVDFIELTDEDKEKLRLLTDFVFVLTGRKIKFVIPKVPKKLNSAEVTNRTVPAGNGWGISYRFSQTIHEEEHTSFQTKGVVKTQDGREIHVNLKMNMSRSFTSSVNFEFRAGDAAIDPLVVNLDGAGTSLGSRNFEFDLDADGVTDKISFVNKGSGFLALDKNKNGIIDNGTELFGPSSGNGFLELSVFDEDQNGWIDENDSIYENLAIWLREDGGEPKLLALGQAGIGAIYLGHVQTQFSLKDNHNNMLGQVRESGIFLFENGLAGTIQHVDLAV